MTSRLTTVTSSRGLAACRNATHFCDNSTHQAHTGSRNLCGPGHYYLAQDWRSVGVCKVVRTGSRVTRGDSRAGPFRATAGPEQGEFRLRLPGNLLGGSKSPILFMIGSLVLGSVVLSMYTPRVPRSSSGRPKLGWASARLLRTAMIRITHVFHAHPTMPYFQVLTATVFLAIIPVSPLKKFSSLRMDLLVHKLISATLPPTSTYPYPKELNFRAPVTTGDSTYFPPLPSGWSPLWCYT